MDLFSSFRKEGFPSQFPSENSPVTIDTAEIIFITPFVLIGIAYLFIIPGYKKRRSIYVCIKVIISIAIGCCLISENFGQEWEVGSVRTRTPYRAGEKHEIVAFIGMKIGLRSVNITLQGKGEEETPLAKEIINYNERFSWVWDQGKFGFGPNAGLLQRSFREAQRRGLPIPILWAAEYFTIDGEGIRFGRFYRTAGWYCHILLWAAFAAWILANIFLQTVGRIAAHLAAITGSLQLICCIVWITVHNPTPLVIPFEDGFIRAQLGFHFWLTLICGILCILVALVLLYMDLRHPNTLSEFLEINPLNEYDECVMKYSKLQSIMQNKKIDNAMELTAVSDYSDYTDNDVVVLRRRSTIKDAQKSLYLSPIPVKIQSLKEEDDAIYENQYMAGLSNSNVQKHDQKEEAAKPLITKKIGGRRVML